METDFIVSELLSELKEENVRKAEQIHRLHRMFLATVLTAVLVIFGIVGIFIWYLNQYDFSAEITNNADAQGTYALIDSSGNVIMSDITPKEVEEVLTNGQSFQVDDDPQAENTHP